MRPSLAAAVAALLALAPAAARGAPTVECHCFRDRSFEPDRPAAADPYVLATARSSLLSAAFGVPKATLVRAVMSGTPPEDLWIAHWAAARTGREAGALLAAAGEARAWRAALAGARGLPPPFAAALARGAAPAALAALAVDDVVTARLAVDPAAVRAVRDAGGASEQLVLAVLVAPRLRLAPAEVLARYRAGASWGALLRDAGLAPEGIDAALRARVR